MSVSSSMIVGGGGGACAATGAVCAGSGEAIRDAMSIQFKPVPYGGDAQNVRGLCLSKREAANGRGLNDIFQ